MTPPKMKVIGYQEVHDKFGRILKAFSPPQTAQLMLHGAEVMAEAVRDNILAQELVDSGDLYDSIEAYIINQYAAGVKTDLVYAAVHEFGLENQPITEKQRRFFWAMFASTNDDMWKALALSQTYTIPARPYMRPAIDENKDEALDAVMRKAGSLLTKIAGIGAKE